MFETKFYKDRIIQAYVLVYIAPVYHLLIFVTIYIKYCNFI